MPLHGTPYTCSVPAAPNRAEVRDGRPSRIAPSSVRGGGGEQGVDVEVDGARRRRRGRRRGDARSASGSASSDARRSGSQRRGHGALEAGAGPGPALADADDLAAVDRHLAGAEAGEADEPAPLPRLHARRGARRRAPSAAAHASPTHHAARPTSSSHSGSPRGTSTSTHSVPPGSSSTAPPPLRRRTTSTSTPACRRRRRAASTRARARAGRRRARAPRARRRRASAGRGGQRRGRPRGGRTSRSTRGGGGGGQERLAEVLRPVVGHRAAGDDRPDDPVRHDRDGAAGASRSRAAGGRACARCTGRQAATTLSQVCSPPLLRGVTWSIESAWAPQYWHRWPSRAMTARRLTATRRRNGTCTNERSRTTDGTGTWMCSACSTMPDGWMQSALSPSTSTTARRAATVPSGSYDALSTRDRPIGAPNVTCDLRGRESVVAFPLEPGHDVVRRRVFGRGRRTASRRGTAATPDRAPGGTAVVATTAVGASSRACRAAVAPQAGRRATAPQPTPSRPPSRSATVSARPAHTSRDDVDEGVERRRPPAARVPCEAELARRRRRVELEHRRVAGSRVSIVRSGTTA